MVDIIVMALLLLVMGRMYRRIERLEIHERLERLRHRD